MLKLTNNTIGRDTSMQAPIGALIWLVLIWHISCIYHRQQVLDLPPTVLNLSMCKTKANKKKNVGNDK